MAVTVGSEVLTSGGGPKTVPVTVGSGSNRALVLLLGIRDTNPGARTVTLDPGGANEATFSALGTLDSSDGLYTQAFYLLETDLPAAGNYNVEVSYSLLDQATVYLPVFLSDVTQAAPTRQDASTSSGTTTLATFSAPPAAYDALDLIIALPTPVGALTPDSGQTKAFETSDTNIDSAASSADSESTMGWTSESTRALRQIAVYMERSASGPSITSVSSDDAIADNEADVAVVGTNFSASGNAVSIEYNGASPGFSASQTIASGDESAASILFDVTLGDIPHTLDASDSPLSGIGSSDVLLQVTDASDNSDTIPIDIRPRSGTNVVSIGASFDTTSANVLSKIPGSVTIAQDDQIQFETTTEGEGTVTMYTDGTFLVTYGESAPGATGSDTFSVWVWTADSGRTVEIPVLLQDGEIAATPSGAGLSIGIGIGI